MARTRCAGYAGELDHGALDRADEGPGGGLTACFAIAALVGG